jgi:hypothetical protein
MAIITLTTGWEWPTLLFLLPLAVLIWLHPGRKEFFSFKLQPQRSAVIMMMLLTGPLLDALAREFDKAANEVRGHQSHWAGMAAFALTLLIIGYLAALRVHGWPLLTWSMGIALAVYGVLSLTQPFDASARPNVTAVFAIAWSGVWIFLAKAGAPVPVVRRHGLVVCTNCGTTNDRRLFDECRRCTVALPDVEHSSPDDIVPISRARKRWRTARLVLGGFSILIAGAAIGEIARTIVAPPVPHSLESSSPRSCLECHATGALHAPIIDWRWHNWYEDEDRNFVPTCSECHDLPEITHSAAIDPGAGALAYQHRSAPNPVLMGHDQQQSTELSALVRSIAAARAVR